MNKAVTKKLLFNNGVINKRQLQELMYQTFHNYGMVKSSIIADRVKNLTFHYATLSGISLNAEDLRVPYQKRKLLGLTNTEVNLTEQKYGIGVLTSVERFQKVIDIWNNASNSLKDEVLTYFRESDPLNPLYIMAFSGARGNISQVRQLVGMRGLMADPQGQIIDLPIKSNFREGLKVTEYVISSYGARKGLVDTALRTADSGYLTRRLVDVAQDIIVREEDCLTQEALSYVDLFQQNDTSLSFQDRIVGRLLASPLRAGKNNTIIANTGDELTFSLINQFKDLNNETLRVRSPLTCDSVRSVCRKCYGWHLSYSRLVDLGEAVGIVAAQSIGEPGTQLTMRTFHTGGVFSGDLTTQIRAPFAGRILYNLKVKTPVVRTMHGEHGFLLSEESELLIQNIKGTQCSLKIPNGSILLVNNKQEVYINQILAEVKKDASLMVEEDRRNIYTEVSGETFFQNIEIETRVDKQGIKSEITKREGLIWVLHGERYSLAQNGVVNVSIGQQITPNMVLAKRQILNKYPGIVQFGSTSGLKILNSSLVLKNSEMTQGRNGRQFVTLFNQNDRKIFELNVQPYKSLNSGQTLAVLKDDRYKTQTGGIVCYNINENVSLKKRRTTKKLFHGLLYWIPEETHVLNPSILENLNVYHNTLIRPGTELWSGNFSKLGGLVSLDELTKELVIKSGELFLLKDQSLKDRFSTNRFVKPGQMVVDNIVAQKLSYIELIEIHDSSYIFVRPVTTYKVPKEKGFFLEHLFFPVNSPSKINLRTIKRIFYKNWEAVKTNQGVNLLQTFLVLDTTLPEVTLNPQIEHLISPFDGTAKLKVSLYETFNLGNLRRSELNENIYSSLNYLVRNNQYIYKNTTVAELKISTKQNGTLIDIKNKDRGTKDLLFLKENDIKKVCWNSNVEKLNVKQGDLVRVGTSLTDGKISPYSGLIYHVNPEHILIRLGRPYLISEGTILRVKPSITVQRSDILATLVYDKLKTVDIVQGLPKVEEILEARKIKDACLLSPCEGKAYLRSSKLEIIDNTGEIHCVPLEIKAKPKFVNGDSVSVAAQLTDGPINPHILLNTLFSYHKKYLPIDEACRKSFKHLQLFLINEVQKTYLSQGVKIADKHIEVIVKQMTSKVKIEESGFTTFLPGEILNLRQVERVTRLARSLNEEPPSYSPILLGLTKASLNSDSFISAASFQETTRVLTEAAIEGKKDWLNGLKENVIIGRLIPAGTGFNSYDHLKKLYQENIEDSLSTQTKFPTLRKDILSFRNNMKKA